MKTVRRLALGILLGAVSGAALTGCIIHALPENYGLNTTNAEPLVSFLQLVFGHLADNPAHCLEAISAVIGAVTGIFVTRAIPHPKFWLAMLSALLVGVVIGATAIYHPGKNMMEWTSAVCEDNADSAYASAYWQALRIMDQAATNQAAITKFQATGRDVLANYLHNTESRAQIWSGKEPVDFLFTNSPFYHIAQKYLATHINNLPIQTNSASP